MDAHNIQIDMSCLSLLHSAVDSRQELPTQRKGDQQQLFEKRCSVLKYHSGGHVVDRKQEIVSALLLKL